jgi:hypothetical protein
MRRTIQTITRHRDTGERYTMNKTFKWDRWYYSFDLSSTDAPQHSSWRQTRSEAFRVAQEAGALFRA